LVLFSNFIVGRYYSMTKEPTRSLMICEIDGKTYKGTYWVAGKALVVSTGMGRLLRSAYQQ
jgi:hypothetical protein